MKLETLDRSSRLSHWMSAFAADEEALQLPRLRPAARVIGVGVWGDFIQGGGPYFFSGPSSVLCIPERVCAAFVLS